MRQGLFAGGYGFVAGASTALILWLMQWLSDRVWDGRDAPWQIFATIMVGGVLIAVLRHFYAGESLAAQVADARDPDANRWRNTLLLAGMAVVAIAFGGAIGPEAGILAVIAEMSTVIAALIARNHAEARLIGEVGASGALGGLYGSPPGGAMIADAEPETPKWQLYLAAVTGLIGFLVVGQRILAGGGFRIHLPSYVPANDGSDFLWAIVPALMGAAVGCLFILILPRAQSAMHKLGGISIQTLVGTALFAALAAAVPLLRFSGHHEMEMLLDPALSLGPVLLIGLAALKMLAMAICLASGWRGGAAFPLLFAGAAAALAPVALLPDMPVTVALVAGMAAAITVGMGRPIAAMLIAVFLIGPIAVGPLCVGGLVGWIVSRYAPKPELH